MNYINTEHQITNLIHRGLNHENLITLIYNDSIFSAKQELLFVHEENKIFYNEIHESGATNPLKLLESFNKHMATFKNNLINSRAMFLFTHKLQENNALFFETPEDVDILLQNIFDIVTTPEQFTIENIKSGLTKTKIFYTLFLKSKETYTINMVAKLDHQYQKPFSINHVNSDTYSSNLAIRHPQDAIRLRLPSSNTFNSYNSKPQSRSSGNDTSQHLDDFIHPENLISEQYCNSAGLITLSKTDEPIRSCFTCLGIHHPPEKHFFKMDMLKLIRDLTLVTPDFNSVSLYKPYQKQKVSDEHIILMRDFFPFLATKLKLLGVGTNSRQPYKRQPPHRFSNQHQRPHKPTKPINNVNVDKNFNHADELNSQINSTLDGTRY